MTDIVAAFEQELAFALVRVEAVRACLAALRGETPSTFSQPKVRRTKKGRANGSHTDGTVLAAVKAGHATVKTIAAETNLPVYNVRQALKRLVAAKALTKTGATASLRYATK